MIAHSALACKALETAGAAAVQILVHWIRHHHLWIFAAFVRHNFLVQANPVEVDRKPLKFCSELVPTVRLCEQMENTPKLGIASVDALEKVALVYKPIKWSLLCKNREIYFGNDFSFYIIYDFLNVNSLIMNVKNELIMLAQPRPFVPSIPPCPTAGSALFRLTEDRERLGFG